MRRGPLLSTVHGPQTLGEAWENGYMTECVLGLIAESGRDSVKQRFAMCSRSALRLKCLHCVSGLGVGRRFSSAPNANSDGVSTAHYG